MLLAVAVSFALGLQMIATQTWTFYHPVQSRGLAPATATVLVLCGGALGLAGFSLGGRLAERRGRRPTLALATSIAALLYAGFYGLPAIGGGALPLLLGALFAGGTLGGNMALTAQRALVTELVVGKSLAEALRAGRKMPFAQVHTLGRVLAQVLAVVHGRNLVHGSLKPSNVMVASGVLKLADLGLGRLAQARNDDAGYGPPEAGLDAACDLYAMAGLMYHLLTGVHPRSQAQGSALPLPSTLATGVPEAFDKLLLRCLHPRRELRLGSAGAILDELKLMVKIG
jgi:serine/threonine protein kinase